MKKLLIILFAFVSIQAKAQFFGLASTGAVPSPDHYVVLTIPSTSVTAQLDSFPVMYFGTATFMKSIANGGFIADASARDVYISTDIAGINIIPFHRIIHNQTTGAFEYAFNSGRLVNTGSNVFYLHFGGTGTTDLSNKTATYNQQYYAVYHFEETITGSSQTMFDATGFSHNLGSFGTWVSGDQVAGIVGGSLVFNGGNGNLTSWNTPTAWSISAFYKTTVANQTTVGLGNASGTQTINNFAGNWHLFGGTVNTDVIATTTPQAINTWAHSAFSTNGANASAYYNGVNQASTTSQGRTFTWSIVGGSSGGFSSTITIDEMRLSTVARSDAWVAAEYLNMNSLGTFMTQSGVN